LPRTSLPHPSLPHLSSSRLHVLRRLGPRSAGFRLTIGSAAFVAAALLLQSALIYWQTMQYEIARTDRLLGREAAVLAGRPRPVLDQQLRIHISDDLRLLIVAAALFGPNQRVINGNLAGWPAGLPLDGHAHQITVHPTDQGARVVRAQALRLPSGDILVLARGLRDLEELQRIVLQSLALTALPSILIAILGGIWLRRRALLRVGMVHQAIERIMSGDLHERLPTKAGEDDLDRLGGSVNRMLDRLEHLVDEIKGVGDDIAHDLRTPLARVRTQLDRARTGPGDPDLLRRAIDRAVADLDQCFSIITALLRITEIENGRRRAGFARVSLREIAADIVDLYEPIADGRQIALSLLPGGAAAWVWGDRDLLIELAANLIDNAIKFTPQGGRVGIRVSPEGGEDRTGGAVLRVEDTGPGIPAAERSAVLGRFYRADKSRHIEGSGLGLSLVAAIGHLHGASLSIDDAQPGCQPPGCAIELSFPLQL